MTTNPEMTRTFSLALDRQPGLIPRKGFSIRRHLLLERTPPEWNVRALGENDFYRYCAAERIVLHEIPMETHGIQMAIPNGRSYIFLSEDLRGAEKLFVSFHELAHHWLHRPRIRLFSRWKDDMEVEADVVAVCAMIPLTALRRYRAGEIAELYGYPPDLVTLRREVFDRWEI